MEEKELEKERLNLDKQENSPILYCDSCGCEIYKNEEYYFLELNGNLCEECFEYYQKKEKKECLRNA